jgi:hypothetical protein
MLADAVRFPLPSRRRFGEIVKRVATSAWIFGQCTHVSLKRAEAKGHGSRCIHHVVPLQEIQLQRYGGGISVLEESGRSVKTGLVRWVIERLQTLPGVQAQIDRGECGWSSRRTSAADRTRPCSYAASADATSGPGDGTIVSVPSRPTPPTVRQHPKS